MKTCQLVVGQLVAHPCGSKASRTCPACQRPVCDRHTDSASQRCAACAGRLPASAAPIAISEAEMMSFDEHELSAFDTSGSPADVDDQRDS